MANSTSLSVIDEQVQNVEQGIVTIREQLMANVSECKALLYDKKSEGEELLAKVTAEGMNDTMDATLAKYIKEAKQTAKDISEKRRPITQMFDLVKKGYTTMEGMLSPKTEDGIVARLQAKRDEYARQKWEEQQRIEQERQRKARIEEAKTSLADMVRHTCYAIQSQALQQNLGFLNNCFNLLTLDNKDEVKRTLEGYALTLDLATEFEKLKPTPSAELEEADARRIIHDTFNEVAPQLQKDYQEKMTELRDELLSLFDSKVAELTELKRQQEIDAEEARKRQEALQREEEERQKQIQARLAEEAQRRADEEQLRKAQAEAEALFEQTSGTEVEKVKAKVKKRITVDTTEGWMEMMRVWWAYCMSIDDLPKKLDFMRKDVERLINSDPAKEQIINHVTITEEVTASTR